MSDNEERREDFEERTNRFMVGLSALSDSTGMHLSPTGDHNDFKLILTGSANEVKYLFSRDGFARVILLNKKKLKKERQMFYSYCSGCGENCLLDAPPLKPLGIRSPIDIYLCKECVDFRELQEKKRKQEK